MEKPIKWALSDLGWNPYYCVSIFGDTWQDGLKTSKTKLQKKRSSRFLTNKGKKLRDGISGVNGDKHVTSESYLDEGRRSVLVPITRMGGLWANFEQTIGVKETVTQKVLNSCD